MIARFDAVTLAAGGVESVVGLALAGQQLNDEKQFYRAIAVVLQARGNRSSAISFSVTRTFDSERAALRFYFGHFDDLPEQGPLRFRFGSDADSEWVRFDDAVIDACEPTLLGVSVTHFYSFRVTKPNFEASAPDVPEPDSAMKADSTPLTAGSDEVVVTFAVPFASTPKITGLTVEIPDAGDRYWAHVKGGSVSTTGFTAVLSAPAPSPATGYKLTWSAIA